MKQMPKELPHVSVVIPAYRVAAYINDAIRSVLAQAAPEVEVIVVNDGSPDTKELEIIIAPYRERIVYLKQENGGVSSARNAGIRAAQGEWLAFLDGDDEWLPGYLQSQLDVVQANDVDMVFSNAVLFGNTPHAGKCTMDFSPVEGEVTFRKVVAGECTIPYCALVRREIVIRAGLFDTRLRGSEDFNLWLRVLKAGGRITYQRTPLFRYRKREGAATSDSVWMNERILESLQRTQETVPMSEQEHAALEKHRRKVRTELALAKGKAAFGNRDWRSAIGHYVEVNKLRPTWKVRMILFLLRLCPGVAYRAYGWMQRHTLMSSNSML
jgi:glycosyltransferase involved in cell wall biosynthesis